TVKIYQFHFQFPEKVCIKILVVCTSLGQGAKSKHLPLHFPEGIEISLQKIPGYIPDDLILRLSILKSNQDGSRRPGFLADNQVGSHVQFLRLLYNPVT